MLAEALAPAADAPRPVAITGPGGIGKSALVSSFAERHAARFPGGYVRLSSAQSTPDDRDLVAALATRLDIAPATENKEEAVRKRLLDPAALLHIEDVDSRAMTLAVAALVRRLRGVAVIVAGRFEALGAGLEGITLRLGPLKPEAAVRLLVTEGVGLEVGEEARIRALAEALGRVPVALRLGARLLQAGEDPAQLVANIEERRSASDDGPPSSGRRLRQALTAQTARAMSVLEARLGDQSEPLLVGFRFFVHAPPGGVGTKLGAALARLDDVDFERLMREAEALALVEKMGAARWRVHPTLTEVAGRREEKETALSSISAWFIARMQDPKEGWPVTLQEKEALTWWLGVVPEGEWGAVVEAGTAFARTNGPFAAWSQFAERALGATSEDARRSGFLWLLANVAQQAGDLERASVAAEEMREIAARAGNEHDRARAWSVIADVHTARGHTREAARILLDEVLPALEPGKRGDERLVVSLKLADLLEQDSHLDSAFEVRKQIADVAARSKHVPLWSNALIGMARIARRRWRLDEARRLIEEALTILKDSPDQLARTSVYVELADTLSLQGYKSDALDIYRGKALPVLRRLEDDAGVALVLSRVASELADIGQRDEALRISVEEVLPMLQRMRNHRAIAAEKMRIADILHAKGALAEAMETYNEALATYQAQGDRSGVAAALQKLARSLHSLGGPEFYERALKTQVAAVEVHKMLGGDHELAVALDRLAEMYESRGDDEKTLKLYEEDVEPLLRKTEARKSLAAVQAKVARLLIGRGESERALKILRDEARPFSATLQDEHQLAAIDSIIADALAAEGDRASALRMYETDILPVVQRLGTVDEKAAVLIKIGALRGRAGVDVAREAVSLGRESGDAREQVLMQETLARLLLRRDQPGDAEEAFDLLTQTLAEARGIHSPRAPALQRLLRHPILERVTIRNFKSIEELVIDFTAPSELPGRWTCIAGINGAGKSAILQAIALVLLGDERAADVGAAWLERMRRRAGDRVHDAEIRATLRVGKERRDVALYLGERGLDRERLENDPDHAAVRAFWIEREKDHVLLSYGPGRNLSEHPDNRHASKADEVRRQMTLFDPLTQVASVEALLESREETKTVWLLLRRLLALVLEGTDLALDANRTAIRFLVRGAVISPVDLPDGFRATIALLADLCATWQQKAPDEAKSGDPSRIRGIILVDEIDLHLHPGLQRSLVPNLRRALPDVQWIVTTHSPLILGSFDKNEIVALEADAEHGVRLHPKLDRQILGFTVDEIYRWLMDVKPRSAALETHFADGPDAHAKKTLILAQSPTVSEQEARELREYRQSLPKHKRRA
ncbi:hypothetical protein A7982_13294 [Minicystis rosea]|nr:hypothetical protein A7982_13294 [Minicystis rosea]